MRNNQDRHGTLDSSNDEPSVRLSEAPVMNNNQMEFVSYQLKLLSFRVKGLFYEEGHPLYHERF